MFESLTNKLARIVKHVKGEARITEKNTQEILREIRLALLEADVALPVVKSFLGKVKERSNGEAVLNSLTPGQAMVGIVKDELINLMSDNSVNKTSLNLSVKPPAKILLAGLQGSGKTTTCGKLSHWIKKNHKGKKILTVSCDIYRPAAIKQLNTISDQAEVDFYPFCNDKSVKEIAEGALDYASINFYDVVIFDTAGRLTVDEKMMNEISSLQNTISPDETLFIVDSMQGQNALEVAKSFNEAINLTGIILTKTDGDVRGGALISVRTVTGCPAKFIGISEKLDGLEKFDPERFSKRLLGMGDVLSLVEKAQENFDADSASKLIDQLQKGKKFTLNEFRLQISQMRSMGGLSSIMGMMPVQIKDATKGKDLESIDHSAKRLEGIILSMTQKERNVPEIIKASRKKRIAIGAGVTVQEVNKLLNQFTQMQTMMKRFGGGTLNKMMNSVGDIGSGLRNKLGPFSKPKNKRKRKSKRR